MNSAVFNQYSFKKDLNITGDPKCLKVVCFKWNLFEIFVIIKAEP